MRLFIRSLSPVSGLLLLFLLIGGCQANRDQSLTLFEETPDTTQTIAPNPQEKTTIALVMKTLTNPFFVEMEKGARRAESELGIELLVKTAAQETSIEQQIGIIETLTQQKVDAIVIAPGSSIELIPILKKAQDKGIVIINIDNRLDPSRSQELGLVNVPFISVDNQKGGYLSAQQISQKMTQPSQVAILEGIQTAQNAKDRKNGALKAFTENTNIEIVASVPANWKIDEAYTVTQTILNQYPNLDALFCANDMMALGAIQYLEENNRSDIWVAGFDALAEAHSAIRSGQLTATIDQQAAQQGYTGVQYAFKALKGESLPPETMIDVVVVTKDNL
jgi:ribose transport system substrate-binding protein